MKTIYIDCAGVTSAPEFWQRYIDAAQPEGADLFGRNLNAFWDAVEVGGPGWPGKAKLVFTNSSQLSSIFVTNNGSMLDGLRRVADEATATVIELV